jgi:putative methionine-R-sulfoxide reductase with GAF domain
MVEEIERIIGLGGDADDVLRAVVAELARDPAVEWAGILFLEESTLVLGPEVGVADPARRISVPVSYQDVVVGELAVDGATESELLEQVAALISTHVLLGWDTGGAAWEP